jgi:hypothetical protein
MGCYTSKEMKFEKLKTFIENENLSSESHFKREVNEFLSLVKPWLNSINERFNFEPDNYFPKAEENNNFYKNSTNRLKKALSDVQISCEMDSEISKEKKNKVYMELKSFFFEVYDEAESISRMREKEFQTYLKVKREHNQRLYSDDYAPEE